MPKATKRVDRDADGPDGGREAREEQQKLDAKRKKEREAHYAKARKARPTLYWLVPEAGRYVGQVEEHSTASEEAIKFWMKGDEQRGPFCRKATDKELKDFRDKQVRSQTGIMVTKG